MGKLKYELNPKFILANQHKTCGGSNFDSDEYAKSSTRFYTDAKTSSDILGLRPTLKGK